MLVSRKFENMSPVPPARQRPSETNKRVRAGRASFFLHIRGRFVCENKYTTYLTKTGLGFVEMVVAISQIFSAI